MARIVIIDDARAIRDLLVCALSKRGHEAYAAESTQVGLEVVARVRPDLILLDLDMPGRDGVACLRELRSTPGTTHTPVIMVSGTPVREVILRVARIGVQGIVLKNEDTIAEILKRVEQLACSPAASSEPLPAAKPPVFELRPAIAPAKPPVYELIQDNHPIPAAPVYEVREDPTRSVGASGRAGTPASAACLNRESAGAFHAVEDPGDLEEAVQELKGLRPVMGRTELMERVLEGCELRAIKPAVQQVLSLTGSASASLEAISRAIRQDQALSLKVLQIANSPLYTRGERVETVQKAVSRIGVTQIRTTVLSLAVIDMLGGSGLVGRIHADWFWEHSIACGLISSRIARARGKRAEEADAMFTAGLLHDIGRLVLAERIPEEYGVVMEAAERLGLPLEMVESRLLMMNHAELSDRLLRQWNFSTALVNPIALHHLGIANIRSAAPRMSESVATIALANRLSHALLLGSSGNETVYPIEEFLDFLRLEDREVFGLCAQTPEDTQELKIQLLLHGGHPGPSLLDETVALLGPEVRPLRIATGQRPTAVSLLLDRLVPASIEERPNLALLPIADAGQRSTAVSALRAAEARAGVSELPTLVVATGKSRLLPAGVLARRRVEQLNLPIRLDRLLRSMAMLAGAHVG